MSANNRQVAGNHYKTEIQHWDYVEANNLDYFQGQITKYVSRWKKKNGITDLEKARHFLEKYIEIETGKLRVATGPVGSGGSLGITREPMPPKVTRISIEQENPFGFDKAKDI